MWECTICNEENPDSVSTCGACGYHCQIAASALTHGKKLVLTMLRPLYGKEVTVLPPGGVISRVNSGIAPEVFNFEDTVSEPHCELSCENGEWYATDLQSTNKTDVNGATLPAQVPVPLPLPCKLRTGGLLWMVREELIAPRIPDDTSEMAPTEVRWVILCPNTRNEYPVDGPDSRIQECTCCLGMNRRRISQAHPVNR